MPRFCVAAVAIDLDGTLLDTLPEITLAIQHMLDALALPRLAESIIRSYIGKGVQNLVQRVLRSVCEAEPSEAEVSAALTLFRDCYARVLGQHSTPYDGAREGLDRFRAMGLRLACITNKATRFTLPLLARKGLDVYFELVVAGDTLPHAKPHPLPLQHAARHFSVAPSRLLMVGDSRNDAQAARAAGCPVLLVPYGYNEGESVDEIDCDGIVASLAAASAYVLPLTQA